MEKMDHGWTSRWFTEVTLSHGNVFRWTEFRDSCDVDHGVGRGALAPGSASMLSIQCKRLPDERLCAFRRLL